LLLRIQQDRYRPAVDQVNFHHGLKLSGFTAQTGRTKARYWDFRE